MPLQRFPAVPDLSQSPVPSPCISVCKMSPATGWCEGCARTLGEIAAWQRAVADGIAQQMEAGEARIVGVMVPGEGIRIFQIHSPRLREHEEDRWIDVTNFSNANPVDAFDFPLHEKIGRAHV